MQYTVKHDRVVGDGNYLDPNVHKPPLGVLLQILTVDGIKIDRAWQDNSKFIAWAPYPSKPEWVDNKVDDYHKNSNEIFNINLSYIFDNLVNKGRFQKDFDISREFILTILNKAINHYGEKTAIDFNTIARLWSKEKQPEKGYWISLSRNYINRVYYIETIYFHTECISQAKKYGQKCDLDRQSFLTNCIINYLNDTNYHLDANNLNRG